MILDVSLSVYSIVRHREIKKKKYCFERDKSTSEKLIKDDDEPSVKKTETDTSANHILMIHRSRWAKGKQPVVKKQSAIRTMYRFFCSKMFRHSTCVTDVDTL